MQHRRQLIIESNYHLHTQPRDLPLTEMSLILILVFAMLKAEFETSDYIYNKFVPKIELKIMQFRSFLSRLITKVIMLFFVYRRKECTLICIICSSLGFRAFNDMRGLFILENQNFLTGKTLLTAVRSDWYKYNIHIPTKSASKMYIKIHKNKFFNKHSHNTHDIDS